MNIHQKLESENCELIERLKEFEAENNHLKSEVGALQKSLEKQKKLYRQFSTDVIETERIRNDSFKSEKRSMTEEIKSLTKENRQLQKDVSFYKKAHEELTNEQKQEGTAHIEHPNQRSPNIRSEFTETHLTRSSTRKQSKTANEPISAPASKCCSAPQVIFQSECKHNSSRALSKVNEKLFIENKKLKLKINSLSANVQLFKTKNRQLENFKTKMTNKKWKFVQDGEEIERLVESSKRKNKDIYTPGILLKLDELCK